MGRTAWVEKIDLEQLRHRMEEKWPKVQLASLIENNQTAGGMGQSLNRSMRLELWQPSQVGGATCLRSRRRHEVFPLRARKIPFTVLEAVCARSSRLRIRWLTAEHWHGSNDDG